MSAAMRSGPVLALTLHQPWASLIACGAKRCETRHWRAPRRTIGRRFAVHAGKAVLKDHDVGTAALTAAASCWDAPWRLLLPFGAVVAYATLESCEPTETVRERMDWREVSLGDFSNGRWAWCLADVEALEVPLEAIGQQGVWSFDPAAASPLPPRDLFEWAR